MSLSSPRDLAAKQRAQGAVKRLCEHARRKGAGHSPQSSLQRSIIHDAELVALIELVGTLLPGGQAQVWDAIAEHAAREADKLEATLVEVAHTMPAKVWGTP